MEHEGKHEVRWWNLRQWRMHRPTLPFVLMLCAVAAALATAGTLWLVYDREAQVAKADTAKAVASDQATTLDQLCATDPDVAKRIPEDCRQAREVRRNVVLPASTPGPSQAQVQGWVDEYVREHPAPAGRDATPEMVARAVAAHMAGNGQQQIAKVAQAYIAAHVAEFRGDKGDAGADGQDGQNATDSQVATAVAAFCAEHDSCRGAQGDKGEHGDQGVGVVDIRPVRNDQGACEWVVTFEDPSTGEQQTVTHPAGDAACPVVQQPPETGGGLLPGG